MTSPTMLISDSIRYDLSDTDTGEYDDAPLLKFINRAIFQLDYVLSSIGSDLVLNESTSVTLAAAANSAATPTNTIIVRDVWIGTTQLDPLVPAMKLYYKRKWISSTGQPNYWCEIGSNLEFEQTSDDDYALTIYYDKATGNLALGGALPYDDKYNNAISQATVIQAKHINELDVSGDAALFQFFMDTVMGRSIAKRYIGQMPEKRKLDF